MVTKRQLGLVFLFLGIAALLGLLAGDWLGAGRFSGIGPIQKLLMVAAGLIALIGISLIPLGNKPA